MRHHELVWRYRRGTWFHRSGQPVTGADLVGVDVPGRVRLAVQRLPLEGLGTREDHALTALAAGPSHSGSPLRGLITNPVIGFDGLWVLPRRLPALWADSAALHVSR